MQEKIEMKKQLEVPSSKLICFGSAARLTNAPGEVGPNEPILPLEYNG